MTTALLLIVSLSGCLAELEDAGRQHLGLGAQISAKLETVEACGEMVCQIIGLELHNRLSKPVSISGVEAVLASGNIVDATGLIGQTIGPMDTRILEVAVPTELLDRVSIVRWVHEETIVSESAVVRAGPQSVPVLDGPGNEPEGVAPVPMPQSDRINVDPAERLRWEFPNPNGLNVSAAFALVAGTLDVCITSIIETEGPCYGSGRASAGSLELVVAGVEPGWHVLEMTCRGGTGCSGRVSMELIGGESDMVLESNLPFGATLDAPLTSGATTVLDIPASGTYQLSTWRVGASQGEFTGEYCILHPDDVGSYMDREPVFCSASGQFDQSSEKATQTVALPAGTHQLAVRCNASERPDNECSLSVTIRSAGSTEPFPFPRGVDGDSLPLGVNQLVLDDRSAFGGFVIDEPGRYQLKAKTYGSSASGFVCVVQPFDVDRHDKATNCLHYQDVSRSGTASLEVELEPGNHGWRAYCSNGSGTPTSCDFNLEIRDANRPFADANAQPRPGGQHMQIPIQQTEEILEGKVKAWAFEVARDMDLHLKLERIRSATASYCLAYGYNWDRAASGESISCVKQGSIGTSPVNEVVALLDGWYVLQMKCSDGYDSPEQCALRRDLSEYGKGHTFQSGATSPSGFTPVNLPYANEWTIEVDHRAVKTFAHPDDGALEWAMDTNGTYASAGMCLMPEDEVNRYLEGQSVKCLEASSWKSSSPDQWSKTLAAGWYALGVQCFDGYHQSSPETCGIEVTLE